MLKEKNQNLLNELSTATAAKQRVQRTKKWVIILSLLMVTIFYFTSNIYIQLVGIALTIFSIFIHFQARQLADQVNLKEKFSIGKRVGGKVAASNTEELFDNGGLKQGTTSKSSDGGSKEATKITTHSPFATNSSIRNRKLAAQSPDYAEEKTSFDPAAAGKLLPVPQEESNDAVRQNAPLDAGGRSMSNSGFGGGVRAMLSHSNLFASSGSSTSGFSNRVAPVDGGVGSGTGYAYSSQQPADSPSHHVYHLSPLNTGAVKGPKPASNKVKDALQVLEIRQLQELWVERLREILGKDLTRIMKFYDESIAKMVEVMRGAGIPAGDLQKAILLLEFRSVTKEEILPSNKCRITLDDVIKYCHHLGLPTETFHMFEQTVSFLKLCQWMVELRQQHLSTSNAMGGAQAGLGRSSGDGYISSFFHSGVTGDRNGKHRKVTPLIDRLRVMAHESSDFGLRIHWSNMDMNEVILSGRIEHEILDQEVAMALFLQRCDSAMLRVASTQPTYSADAKFSRTHYAYSSRDVNHRVRQLLFNQVAGGFGGGQQVQTILLQRTVADVASSSGGGENSSIGLAGISKPPHYDILRVVLDGSGNSTSGIMGSAGLEEILTVDVSRHDVFESIIVFMLVLYFTSSHDSYSDTSSISSGHTSGDDSIGGDHHLHDDDVIGTARSTSASSSLVGSVDYRVIKHLIEEIVGRDELKQLIQTQRSARAKQQAMMKSMHRDDKLVSSGFGFGMGLAYASPGSANSGVFGANRSSGSPSSHLYGSGAGGSPHYHHHHLHMPNIAVSSQIRMPASHSHSYAHSASTSPTNTPVTSGMSMTSSMFNNLRQSNILSGGGNDKDSVSNAVKSNGYTPMSVVSGGGNSSNASRSFRSMFASSDASLNDSSLGFGGNTSINDSSYSHNFTRYMNPANSFSSPQ